VQDGGIRQKTMKRAFCGELYHEKVTKNHYLSCVCKQYFVKLSAIHHESARHISDGKL